MNQTEIFKVIRKLTGQENIIAVPRIFIEITKDLRSALMLSQLIYWSGKTNHPKGLIYKTNKDFSKELGLTDYAIKKAKKALTKLKLINTEVHKANSVPTTHYQVNESNLMSMINDLTVLADVDPTEKVDVDQIHNKDYKQETTNNLFPSGNKVASDRPSCLDAEVWGKGVELNRFWKLIIGKGGHTSLESKFLVTGKYGGSDRKSLPVWAPITSAIRSVGLDVLKRGINHFKETQDTQDEYMLGSTWSLAEFCHNRNYLKYIDGVPEKKFASTDPWDIIRNRFSPLTSVYVDTFDTKTQRYYGFQLDKINSDIRYEDIFYMMNARNDQWGFNDFMELEWMIAGLLWRRKKADREYDLQICQTYIARWEELKDGFKKEARKWLKEDWELYG